MFVLLMLAASLFFLDGLRSRLVEQRATFAARDATVAAATLSATPPERRAALAGSVGRLSDARLRVYGADGAKRYDSWAATGESYRLRDPETQPWRKDAARFFDRTVDWLSGIRPPPLFVEPELDGLGAWPVAVRAAAGAAPPLAEVRRAPDLTPVFLSAARLADGGVLLLTANDRAITRAVRAERSTLALLLIGVTLFSAFLSYFLARTIAAPLRRLATAAHRVRQGRARDVVVPRLPERRDEIGTLARALGDMTQSLRQRIDATEAFAADVTHELKNPLASLRSALDTLGYVHNDEQRRLLLDVARDDVRRLDRLITDVAEASRLDAELSRARFEPVDVGQLLEALIGVREARGLPRGVAFAFARPHLGTTVVLGEEGRLARVFDNLLDNALSFSPDGGLIRVGATRDGEQVKVTVVDQGPGVPEESREAVFERFHSIRPDGENFGRHSGLGLAIARAIVEGHGGTIGVTARGDGRPGARFVICLPGAPA
ncbi:MAG: Sensor histidine kinase ChvG [uncultured Sphingomonadaceae bacterium]|uniref:histidine kinase n=1 Tax=uncultured Sphingomonadaceae bacterium TaxID=169976 RepID=A0A6J4TER0_9SPHN|nr:MAG: Sensor histidine kinase ChvG [uncultured Sphingomonadaceae bacterium]